MAHECRKAGLTVQQQQGIEVRYDGIVVGEYFADLLVKGSVIVELKSRLTEQTIELQWTTSGALQLICIVG